MNFSFLFHNFLFGIFSKSPPVFHEDSLKSDDFKLLKDKSSLKRIFKGRSIKRSDMIEFCTYLEQLLQAGIPLLESLQEIIMLFEKRRFQPVLKEIYWQVGQGIKLSAALENYPSIFDRTFIGIMQGGEAIGRLSQGCLDLVFYLKWREEISHKLFKALLYPSLVFLVILMTVVIMGVGFLPQLQDFFHAFELPLPYFIQIFLKIGPGLQSYGGLILGVAALIGGLFYFLSRFSISFNKILEKLYYQWPFIGKLRQDSDIFHLLRLIGVLHKNNIPLLESLLIAQKSVGNFYFQRLIDQVHQRILQGHRFSVALESIPFISSLVIRMLRIGEISDGLNRSLEILNYFCETGLKKKIDSFIDTLQPLLIMILGSIMAGIMATVLYPLYTTLAQVSW